MQHIYADMQLIYVDMQYIYGDVQLIYLDTQLIHVNKQLTRIYVDMQRMLNVACWQITKVNANIIILLMNKNMTAFKINLQGQMTHLRGRIIPV